jgi:hypothetical protein
LDEEVMERVVGVEGSGGGDEGGEEYGCATKKNYLV